MERDCESELSKLNIEQNACIYHFGASVIHGQRSNILRLPYLSKKPLAVGIKLMAKGFLSSLFIWFEFVLEHFDQSVAKCL